MASRGKSKPLSNESQEALIRSAKDRFTRSGECFIEDPDFDDPEDRRAEILAIIKKDRTKVFWERLWVVQDPSFGPTGFRNVDDGAFQITRFYDPKRCSRTGHMGDWRRKSPPDRLVLTDEEIACARKGVSERNQEEKREKLQKSLENGFMISAGFLMLLGFLGGGVFFVLLGCLSFLLWGGTLIAKDWKEIWGYWMGFFRFLISGYSIALWIMIGGPFFFGFFFSFFFEEPTISGLWGGLGSCVAALIVLMIQRQKEKASGEGCGFLLALLAILGVIFWAIGLWIAFEAFEDAAI